ncbi:winged helix-turn-helix transcriptional regulator [Nocardia sp. CA-135953]|uniref:winged helix-turn-helix transcriptional regulator n=1 Tax=Nocardia sp. CA-135953 TaxID=3239978 RepID=UPI003D962EB8
MPRRAAHGGRAGALQRSAPSARWHHPERILSNLERDGLVHRAVYPTVPPRVEYSLTDLGASLGELSHAMRVWSVQHHSEILTARDEFDTRAATAPRPV